MRKQKMKDVADTECIQRFLKIYNKNNKTYFSGIEKNMIQDEIDYFIKDGRGDILKIQITVSDNLRFGIFEKMVSDKNRGKYSGLIFSIRDRHDVGEVSRAIESKKEKYKKQRKSMDDVFLLLDDTMGDIPESAFKTKVKDDFFKEVWYVGRTNCIYKIS